MPTPLWKEGQSGNPNGRPKGKSFADYLTDDDKERVVKNILSLANDGDKKTRLKANEILAGYIFGRPKQITEITGEDGGKLEVEVNFTNEVKDTSIKALKTII